jgi:ABC-2 type transport system ATP-binding protein
MSDYIAIKAENVSKTFRLPHEKTTSIKGAVLNFYKRKRVYEKQQVLEDISFEIEKGEFFGIVGRNGSGKSTLLKMMAGIYSPSKGAIRTDGKITPFIELGVGFNPELTGRENVFLNGALLGFSRKEVQSMYADIVSFAELERFMDQKLKNYSSGMQVRLAFSIAIQVKSNILILDEVLAVGDEAFQRKCIKVFDNYKKNKQTVILVTHDMETVKKYCTRAILLSDGKIMEEGNPHEVANKYSKLNQTGSGNRERAGAGAKSDIKLKILDAKTGDYEYGDTMKVSMSWPEDKKVDTAGIAVYASTGECAFATNTAIDKYPLEKHNAVEYTVDLELGAGNYFLMAGTFTGKDHEIADFISEGPSFTMGRDGDEIRGEGVTRLKHTWDRR